MSKPVLTLEDGGPAFPLGPYDLEPGLSTLPVHGMSLRDWFAGQALCAVQVYLPATDYEPEEGWRNALAAEAYRVADAMLASRLRAVSQP